MVSLGWHLEKLSVSSTSTSTLWTDKADHLLMHHIRFLSSKDAQIHEESNIWDLYTV